MRLMVLTCRQFTLVATEYLEEHLSHAARIQAWFHLSWCRRCRAYLRQFIRDDPYAASHFKGVGDLLRDRGHHADAVKYYDIFLEELANGDPVPASSREKAVQERVEMFASRLEHYCQQAPFQWFNFFDFWAETEHGRN